MADHLEAVHEAGGRNGGIILTKSYSRPGALRDFVELVVPDLQRRGLMRKRYMTDALRGNLNNLTTRPRARERSHVSSPVYSTRFEKARHPDAQIHRAACRRIS